MRVEWIWGGEKTTAGYSIYIFKFQKDILSSVFLSSAPAAAHAVYRHLLPCGSMGVPYGPVQL